MKMNEIDTSKITEAITKTEELLRILREMANGVETTRREVYEVEYYTSKSGNPTWKLFCEDGAIIYLRQSQRESLEQWGYWEKLNKMPLGSTYACHAVIDTVKDGDFHKMVSGSVLIGERFD